MKMWNDRRLLVTVGVVVTVALGLLALLVLKKSSARPRSDTNRPNIIFILADDLGYGDLGCYGQQLIETPNLDQMAAEGLRFTDFYSGSPVCGAARCSLMTGFHLGHTYIRANSPATPLRPEDVTVAEVLKPAGYATAEIGKWALGRAESTGSPDHQGFDYSFGYLDHGEAHDYYPHHLWRNGQQVMISPGTYSHDLFTREALDFIKRESGRAFFLYLAYTVPHGPAQVPNDQPYHDKPWPQDAKDRAAMVTRMDRDIGQILGLLKKLEIDSNTVVFFSSDNGPKSSGFFQSIAPLNGQKRDLYEGGIRVPMIVRWPSKIKPGQVNRQPWAFWDFLPTAAEIAGAAHPIGIDGISILPTLLRREQKQHSFLYWEFHIKNRRGVLQAARMGKWKALRREKSRHIELYDLNTDLREQSDVAAKNPKIVREIEKVMIREHVESHIWPSGLQQREK